MSSFAPTAFLPVILALLSIAGGSAYAETSPQDDSHSTAASPILPQPMKAKHRRHRQPKISTVEPTMPEPATPKAETERSEGKVARKPTNTGGPTVLGDSIGIGLSMASGTPRLAHEGVAIRSSAALAQLHHVADRSVVVLSLGTNDAVGSIKGVEGAIDRIVAVAEHNNLRIVWLGPPCVFKSWNITAERLDAVLKHRLSDENRIRYVSAADAEVCDRSLRAGDGVHFTMKGYAMLWKRVLAAEGEWAAYSARDAVVAAPARTASNDRRTMSSEDPR